jgi:hypothetical protein
MLFNPLNDKLNPICHFLALLEAHPIPHVSRIRVKLLWKEEMGRKSSGEEVVNDKGRKHLKNSSNT